MEPTRSERFEALFRENYAAVRAHALRRAPRDVAEDAVAETFLVAWRRLDDVPVDALPWLSGVARRVLSNQRRSACRHAALERRLAETVPAAGQGDPGERAGAAEILRAALARLSDRDREALMLVAWHGLSGARAAVPPAAPARPSPSGSTGRASGLRLASARPSHRPSAWMRTHWR